MNCTEDMIDWNCDCKCCQNRNMIVRDLMAEYNGLMLAERKRITELEAALKKIAGTCEYCADEAIRALRRLIDHTEKIELLRSWVETKDKRIAELEAEVEQLKEHLAKRGLGICQVAIENGIDPDKCSGTDPDTICPPAMSEDIELCKTCKYRLDALVDCRDCKREDYAWYERNTNSD